MGSIKQVHSTHGLRVQGQDLREFYDMSNNGEPSQFPRAERGTFGSDIEEPTRRLLTVQVGLPNAAVCGKVS